jgi:hypothetical protein
VKKKQRQALQKQSHFSKQKTSIVDQIKKQSPTIAYLPETRLMSKDKHMLMWDDGKRTSKQMKPQIELYSSLTKQTSTQNHSGEAKVASS